MAHWHNLDLNLLRILEAMLSDPNTTRVASRVGLSQPAVSKSLSRLRVALGDPLFVREGNTMVATPYALSLAAPLSSLQVLWEAVDRSPFEPKLLSRTFRILCDDFFAELVVPRLIAHLASHAPDVSVRLLAIKPRPVGELLANEPSLDLAFARIDAAPPPWIDCYEVASVRPVVIARRSNNRLKVARVADGEVLPLLLYCDMAQVAFAPDDVIAAREDVALGKLGKTRRVVLTVPEFISLARIVSRTELIGSLPPVLARSLAPSLRLSVHPLPLDIENVPLGLFWHRRLAEDPPHRWFRNLVADLLDGAGRRG